MAYKIFDKGDYFIPLLKNDIINVLSYELIDLLMRILQKNERNRITSDQLLQHSFIKNDYTKLHKIKLDEINPKYLNESKDCIVLNINTQFYIKKI